LTEELKCGGFVPFLMGIILEVIFDLFISNYPSIANNSSTVVTNSFDLFMNQKHKQF